MERLILIITVLLASAAQSQDLTSAISSNKCPTKCRCFPIKPKSGAAPQARQSVPASAALTSSPKSRLTLSSANNGPSGISAGTRVRCGNGTETVKTLNELEASLFPPDTTQLELEGNHITDIPRAGFAYLPLLQKLDLRNNNIKQLAKESFFNLTNLKRLDLSGNRLTRLGGGVFLGLEKLTHLRLAQNVLTSIAEGAFDDLIMLKNLDLSGNPLECDCQLAWLVDWIGKESVKLTDGSECHSPPNLEGKELSSVSSSSLVCRPFVSLPPTLEMHPDSDQVVFERDSLRLSCVVTGPTRSAATISWLWQNHREPTVKFPDIKANVRFVFDQSATVSTLTIGQLASEHSGKWECISANMSYSIALMVISSSTQFCPQTVSTGNKGSYTWPRSLVGTVVELPCAASPPVPLTSMTAMTHFVLVPPKPAAVPKASIARASYTCGQNAAWENLNVSSCAFLSVTTKTLEQFSKMSLRESPVLQSAQLLYNFTRDSRQLTDKMDIVFLTQIIEKFLYFITHEKELAPLLVGVVSSTLSLPPALLAEAQADDGACQRLVTAIEVIAEHSPMQSQPGVAVESLQVSRERFQGVTCVWYADPEGVRPRLFHCSSNEKTLPSSASLENLELIASVQLPSTLFYQLPRPPGPARPNPQLVVSMFTNARLFPETNTSQTWGVTSSVIGCKFVGDVEPAADVLSPMSPVWVQIQAPLDSAARPVVWDGRGTWSEDGCSLSRTFGSLLVFKCTRLGYYAIRQDLTPPYSTPVGPPPLPSRPSPPALYAGSLLIGASLLIAIITYIACWRDLRMPAKTKHSLINTWVVILILSLTFSCGIHQTGQVFLCQGVGLLLHYLSLCCLLWMTVTISNLHKQLTAGDNICDDEEEPAGEMPVPPQPMLGFYLVGYGIALIICGISGAVNLRHYAGPSLCFLAPTNSVSAVLVPACGVLAVLTILWLLTHCAAARHTSESGRISQGTQATERVDLELLGPRAPSPCMSSGSSSSQSSDLEDGERSPRSQLLAHLAVLFLFLLGWSCGAAAIATPTIPYQATIFSCFYAVMSAALGAFVLGYFCVGRRDVTSEWKLARHPHDWWCSGFKAKNKQQTPANGECVALTQPVRNLGNPPPRPPPSLSALTSAVAPPAPSLLGMESDLPMSKSCIAEDDEPESDLVDKVCQLRALVMPPVSVVTEGSVSGVEVFYNPHQLGVARKFFRKQRLIKRNNAAAAATTSCAATSDAESLFSAGSKVNNTNIHATGPHNSKLNNRVNKDPNLLLYPPDFTTHRNVFDRYHRAHSPLSSVSEARTPRVRRAPRAHSADELGDPYPVDSYLDNSKQQRASTRHRTRRRHRRGSRGARVHESSLASVTNLRSKQTFAADSAGDSDAKKETCV